MSEPYIGITGFNSLEQVNELNKQIENYPIGYLMYGFTSSNKRLADPTSSGKTSPSLNSLKEMVDAVPAQHLPMIHYFTSNPDKLGYEILNLFARCKLDPKRVGLQINALWPNTGHLTTLKLIGHTITLQLPAKALEIESIRVVDALKCYIKAVDYALIDPSGGQGKDFSIGHASSLMTLIKKEIPEITPGVAGGFSSDNVRERIRAIREYSKCRACHQPELHDYCIDAQGKLRVNGQLDIPKAISFIDRALGAFTE